MPIRVTCSKCMARFNVSEKFAGREGPCPKCKTQIKIPDLESQVVIHAPETAGPKDSKGRLILKPLRRKEADISPANIATVAVTIVAFLMASFLLSHFYRDDLASIPWYAITAILTLLAPACVLGAYTFLRDQEAGVFVGRELLYRVLVCSGIYALSWGAMPVASYALNNHYGPSTWFAASLVMLAIGVTAAVYAMDLDWLFGTVHYGFYFGSSLLLRLCAGVGLFPGTGKSTISVPDQPLNTPGTDMTTPEMPIGLLDDTFDRAITMVGWMGEMFR